MSRTPEDILDELLVLQSQEGDGEALKSLITRWQPRLGRLAWRLTADREAARDIVQEVWLSIVRGLNRLEDPARFRSWAYSILTNKCTDWTRRRIVQRKAAESLKNSVSSVSSELSNGACTGDATARLRQAMKQLPAEQKAILSLHYLDGMAVTEIARVLMVPIGTVKSRLYHARNRLRQTLERTIS